MQIIDADATRAALPFDRLVSALRERFKGGCETPTRHVHEVANPLGDAGGDAQARRMTSLINVRRLFSSSAINTRGAWSLFITGFMGVFSEGNVKLRRL